MFWVEYFGQNIVKTTVYFNDALNPCKGVVSADSPTVSYYACENNAISYPNSFPIRSLNSASSISQNIDIIKAKVMEPGCSIKGSEEDGFLLRLFSKIETTLEISTLNGDTINFLTNCLS